MSASLGEGQISQEVCLFAAVGVIAGAVLAGAEIGLLGVIASTIVFGLAGGIFGSLLQS